MDNKDNIDNSSSYTEFSEEKSKTTKKRKEPKLEPTHSSIEDQEDDNHILGTSIWNKQNEKFVKRIGEQSIGYSWMHSKNSSHYRVRYVALEILNILFATLAGTAAITDIFNGHSWGLIVIGLVMYLSAVITSITNLLGYKDKYKDHKKASSKFRNIYHDIQRQFNLPSTDRLPADKYTLTIVKKYDGYIEKYPGIKKKFINAYIKEFKESGIAFPEIAGGIKPIEINSESQKKNKRKSIYFKNSIDDQQNNNGRFTKSYSEYIDPKIAYEMSRLTHFNNE